MLNTQKKDIEPDFEAWEIVGETEDGLKIRRRPTFTKRFNVQTDGVIMDPIKGTLYAAFVWPEIVKKRAQSAAMEMLKALQTIQSEVNAGESGEIEMANLLIKIGAIADEAILKGEGR